MNNENSGNRNTGNRNTGNCNSGNRNTGNCNSGNRNTGNRNTGSCNSGAWNTGNRNTGNRNTGGCNSGNWNTGNRNTGGCNSGNWNSGNKNTGFFNTTTPDKINIFDVLTDRSLWDECDKPQFIHFNLTDWIESENMTHEEKAANETHGDTGGYLKTLDYKTAFQSSYDNASEEDRKKIFNIPNFDADKFLEISGIDVRVNKEKELKKAELIAKAEELLEQARRI